MHGRSILPKINVAQTIVDVVKGFNKEYKLDEICYSYIYRFDKAKYLLAAANCCHLLTRLQLMTASTAAKYIARLYKTCFAKSSG